MVGEMVCNVAVFLSLHCANGLRSAVLVAGGTGLLVKPNDVAGRVSGVVGIRVLEMSGWAVMSVMSDWHPKIRYPTHLLWVRFLGRQNQLGFTLDIVSSMHQFVPLAGFWGILSASLYIQRGTQADRAAVS